MATRLRERESRGHDMFAARSNCGSPSKEESVPLRQNKRDETEKYDDRHSKRPRLNVSSSPISTHLIFLQNLDYMLSEREIHDALTRQTSARIVGVRCLVSRHLSRSRRNNGVCIVFIDRSDEDSRRRICQLNGQKFRGGRTLSVVDGHSHANTVIVRHPGSIRDERDLRGLFSGCRIQSIRREPGQQSSIQFAWLVTMEDEDSVVRALERRPYPDRIVVGVSNSRSVHGSEKRLSLGFENAGSVKKGFREDLGVQDEKHTKGIDDAKQQQSSVRKEVKLSTEEEQKSGSRSEEHFDRSALASESKEFRSSERLDSVCGVGGAADTAHDGAPVSLDQNVKADREPSQSNRSLSPLSNDVKKARQSRTGFCDNSADNRQHDEGRSQAQTDSSTMEARSPSNGRPMQTTHGEGTTPTALESRDADRLKQIVADVEQCFSELFSPGCACLLTNLPFHLGADVAAHEQIIISCLRDSNVLAAVRKIEFLGRKKTSAILAFRDKNGLEELTRCGYSVRAPGDKHWRDIDIVIMRKEMQVVARYISPRLIAGLHELCGAASISFSTKFGDGVISTSNEVSVLKLLALDGYIVNGTHVNVHLRNPDKTRSIKASHPTRSSPDSRHRRRTIPSDSGEFQSSAASEWRIRFENAPFEYDAERIRDHLLSRGVRWKLRVRMLRRGQFIFEGDHPDDFRRIMHLDGSEFGPAANMRSMVLIPEADPSAERVTAPKLTSSSKREFDSLDGPDYNGRRLGGESKRSKGGSPGYYSETRRRSSSFSGRYSEAFEPSPREARVNRELDPHFHSRRNHMSETSDAKRELSRERRKLSFSRGDRVSERRDSESLQPRRRVATPSGVSRGFQASPVTPSPNEFVSSIKKVERKVLDPSLPSIRRRVELLREDIFKGIPSPPAGTYEDFCKSIPDMCEEQELKYTLSDNDTPYAPHVWQGTVYMGKGCTDTPAHCNGYLVVRQDQTDEVIRSVLDMLSETICLEYRIGWEETRFVHLLHSKAVVLMIRSSGEIEDELSAVKDASRRTKNEGDLRNRSNSAIAAIASQKNFLGMLRNLRDKQRIGLARYSKRKYPKLVALCVPPSAHAFEKLSIPWRFRDMAGHDTMLLVVGIPKPSKT